MSVSWSGGTPRWRAVGNKLMFGPQIVDYRMTNLGARFAAWRRNRSGATP